jgi:hypothetical protein
MKIEGNDTITANKEVDMSDRSCEEEEDLILHPTTLHHLYLIL